MDSRNDVEEQQDQCSFSNLTQALSQRLRELQQLNCLKLDGEADGQESARCWLHQQLRDHVLSCICRVGTGPVHERSPRPGGKSWHDCRTCCGVPLPMYAKRSTMQAYPDVFRRPTCVLWSNMFRISSTSLPRRQQPSPRCARGACNLQQHAASASQCMITMTHTPPAATLQAKALLEAAAAQQHHLQHVAANLPARLPSLHHQAAEAPAAAATAAAATATGVTGAGAAAANLPAGSKQAAAAQAGAATNATAAGTFLTPSFSTQ
jgi:hypothetical protein